MRGARIVSSLGSVVLIALPLGAADGRDPAHPWCGTTREGTFNALWAHRAERQRREPARAAAAYADHDVGNIAVLQDQGDLMLLANYMDLQGAGLRFTPAGSGYSVARVDMPVAAVSGTTLMLGDDASTSVALPFAFPFYGQSYSSAFVNSDGNLTFGAGDNASTERSIGRFMGGAPRIAPLFTDLNPETGGTVTAGSSGGGFAVTWSAVPQYGKADKNTFQVTLYPDGHVDFSLDKGVSADVEGVVGVAPGKSTNGLQVVDLSKAAGASGSGAIGEGFRGSEDVDIVAVAQRFYQSHPDSFQQLVMFTSRKVRGVSYYAYEFNVKNLDQGIGLDMLDFSAEFGSRAGVLESFLNMDFLLKYPDNVEAPLLGPTSAMSIFGQESGHRWLANLRFKDGAATSDELLGRSLVHWSFFMDSDASHMEGNDIQDLGGGQFTTVAAGQRFNALDQYVMGILPAEQVPPFFVVRNPQLNGAADRERGPELGVSFTGTRKDVTIGDVIAAMGPRVPPANPAKPPFRQAFIYVAIGAPADQAATDKMERLRSAWEPFFAKSVDGRWSVDTRLNP